MKDLGCEEALALLMDHVKRELPPDIAEAVQRHLEACRPCEQHAEFEARFVFVVEQRLRKDQCPESVRARILDALRKEAQ